MKLAFLDIDGTLLDDRHRRHYIMDGRKQWGLYLSAEEMEKDSALADGVQLYHDLLNQDYMITFLTGRYERCRSVTQRKLAEYQMWERDHILTMRQAPRPSQVQFKLNVLDAYDADIYASEKTVLYDDNSEVVKMANLHFKPAKTFEAHLVTWAQDTQP